MEQERIDEEQARQVISQIEALGAAIARDPEPFTDWEKSFVADHQARVEKWGENTYFSPRQAMVIAKIHGERVEQASCP